jgi:hypothetical protein
VKALTVRQPWAEAIACGAKLVENRSFSASYRGPLAIHAAKGWAEWGVYDERLLALWPKGGVGRFGYSLRHVPAYHGRPPSPFRAGVVLAVAELVDVHPAVGCCKPWGEDHYAASDGRRRSNVHHWVLEGVMRLDQPVPARGRLGLWTPDPDLLEELVAG